MLLNVKARLFGAQSLEVDFAPGLNIISGSNGTGKTRLLYYLATQRSRQGNSIRPSDDISLSSSQPIRTAAFSPIRSLQKTAIDKAYQAARGTNANKQALNQISQSQMSDFDPLQIRGFASYLAIATELITERQRVTKEDAAALVAAEYGKLVNDLFGYHLNFSWDYDSGAMHVDIQKSDGVLVPPESLSTGETALLSLAAAIYHSRDSVDLYLVDEPEVHLNWSLEYNLFAYLDEFASSYGKQLIVATHSRVVFTERFRSKSQFLSWAGDQVMVSTDPPPDVRAQLAGDLALTVQGFTRDRPLLYVEDKAHEGVINAVSNALNLEVDVNRVGNSSHVVKLARSFSELDLGGVHCLIDNDNHDHDDKPDNVIVLSKYCIENYLLDWETLGSIKTTGVDPFDALKTQIGKSSDNVTAVLRTVLRLNPEISKDDFSQLLDRVDASRLIYPLLERLGFPNARKDPVNFISAYVAELKERGELESHFSDLRLSAISISR